MNYHVILNCNTARIHCAISQSGAETGKVRDTWVYNMTVDDTSSHANDGGGYTASSLSGGRIPIVYAISVSRNKKCEKKVVKTLIVTWPVKFHNVEIRYPVIVVQT